MKILLLFLLSLPLLSWVSKPAAKHGVYEGTWRTTNRKLDGTMTCEVTDLGGGQWRGRFFGVWQGVSFDYPVSFSGPSSQLTGSATIDGADYVWTGEMRQGTPGWFKGTFGGTRYEGYFDLKQKNRQASKTVIPAGRS